MVKSVGWPRTDRCVSDSPKNADHATFKMSHKQILARAKWHLWHSATLERAPLTSDDSVRSVSSWPLLPQVPWAAAARGPLLPGTGPGHQGGPGEATSPSPDYSCIFRRRWGRPTSRTGAEAIFCSCPDHSLPRAAWAVDSKSVLCHLADAKRQIHQKQYNAKRSLGIKPRNVQLRDKPRNPLTAWQFP